MDKIDVNSVYVLAAAGDKEAFSTLYKWFMSTGIKLATSIAKQKGIYTFNREAILDGIEEIFFLSLNSYIHNKTSFRNYALFLLRKKMFRLIVDTAFNDSNVLSLDRSSVDGFNLYDIVASGDYEEMRQAINYEGRKLMMFSKNGIIYKIDDQMKEIIALKEIGYTKKSIMQKMNLTDGKYRYIIRKLSNIVRGKSQIDLK